MEKPSSTIQATAIGGGIASLLFGLLAMFLPDKYALVPPGMEAGTAVLFAVAVGYATKEKVLAERFAAQVKAGKAPTP